MANILCVTSDLSGLLYTSLELSHRLAAAGHSMTYASFAGARDIVEDHGLDFMELAPSRYEEFLETDVEAGLFRRLLTLEQRRKRAVEATAVEGFSRALREMAPDLMIVDAELHEHILAASDSGVHTVLLNTFVSIWRQPGFPPPSRFVRPGVGWAGTRIGTSLLWSELRLKKIRRAWWHKLVRLGCDRQSVLNALALRHGFDLRGETDCSQWPIPFTYRHLPVLSLHALEFEFQRSTPEHVHYVGPMVPERRLDRRSTPEIGSAIQRILEKRRARDRERPLVYAGFGSFFTSGVNFLRRLVDGLADADLDLIISLGGRLEPADLGTLPEWAHAFSWVPQLRVLQHADVAVVHGGANTADECIVNGVPMLVYCGYETDMAGVTARIVHHGLGIAGDHRRDGPEVIRQHLTRLLRDSRYRDNVQRFRACYARYAEDRVAERVVEKLLRSANESGVRNSCGVGS